MRQKRLIAIGDIHGCIDKLNSLLEKLQPKSSDTIVFTGDYIDIGGHSKEVIEKLIQLQTQTSCIFLKGNHEDLLLKAKDGNFREMAHWYMIGENKTFENYGDIDKIFEIHNIFFLNLKLYYSTDKYFFTHGGINPNKPLKEHLDEEFLWARHNFKEKPQGEIAQNRQKLVCGHTPTPNNLPYKDKYSICIDTACGKGGKLTALIIEDNNETFVQSD